MSTEAERRVIDLLQFPGAAQIRLQQDGVIMKGNFTDDSRNYTGSLIVVQHYQSPTTDNEISQAPEQTSAKESTAETDSIPHVFTPIKTSTPQNTNVYYLIWVSYTFLATYLPRILPPEMYGRIAPCEETTVPVEWSFTMCVAVNTIARIQRRSNLQGMRIITVTLTNAEILRPLIFQQGGITKFFEVFRDISPFRQSRFIADDFIIYSEDDVAPPLTTDANGRKLSDTSFHSTQTHSKRFITPNEMHHLLYNTVSNRGRWRYTLATAIHAVRTGVQRSQSALQRSLPGTPNPSDGPIPEDSFEFIEPLIPTEHLVPHIRDAPPRAMGPPLTAAEWSACFTGDERRVDPQRLAKARAVAFAGGIDDSIRLEVWHFLLRVYPEDATEAQREEVRDRYRSMYEKLTAQWTSIFPEQEQRFTAFREVRAAIMKDVVRTDRAHPSYAGDESEKQQMLRDVLMAYAMFNFDLGYCQGMSDILSIIALLSKSNVEAFTCFSCFLSERCENNFRQDVRVGMGEQLNALQTLIRHFVPCLYVHLVKQHADDMSFCFRWLLMLFKREFPIKDTMLLWDVLLSCPYTPQFEIFLAAALLKALTPQILQQHLTYDELLKFANGVAGVLDVRHVIVLAQDFYDEVASRTFELGTSRALQSGNYRPTLSDIMRVLSDPGG